MIEGDYETYQRIAATEAETATAAVARAQASQPDAPADPGSKGDRRKRKFPYRKPEEIEKEIGKTEAEVADLQDRLGQPATWRDPVKARDAQLRHDDLAANLVRLYEHWEEALDLNN